MQITLRSQMIAGATAVVGAGAIALTPIAPAAGIPALSTAKAEVALSALANPITAIIQTAGVAGNYLLQAGYSLVNPAANWVASGTPTFPGGIGLLLNGALTQDALGGYSQVGLVGQILDDSLPIATQLLINGIDYIYNTVSAVAVAGAAIGDIIWAVPATAVAVLTDLLTFDIAGAIAEITNAITGVFDDISTAGTALLDAGTYVLSGVVARTVAVVGAITAEIPLLIGATVGQVTQVISKVVAAGSAILSSFATLNPETIWNTAVAQLLSPVGIPGTLLNLSLGAGLQTGVIASAGDIAANFVPSGRTVVQTGVKAIANALATPVPSSTAAEAAPAASAVRADVAAAPAVEAAPAADAPAGDAAPSVSDARSAAAEAPVAAAPEAAEAAAGDSAPASDAPAKTGKAGASKGGRG